MQIVDNTILARCLQQTEGTASQLSPQSHRAFSFATVGGTRRSAIKSATTAHIELSTVAFQSLRSCKAWFPVENSRIQKLAVIMTYMDGAFKFNREQKGLRSLTCRPLNGALTNWLGHSPIQFRPVPALAIAVLLEISGGPHSEVRESTRTNRSGDAGYSRGGTNSLLSDKHRHSGQTRAEQSGCSAMVIFHCKSR
ncbi:hypothetical protein UFOVP1444_36 [uncultured Caudovirales phage]|uniref:Uncharacterized protein n=1 Tax=uncultured Caudovirales phage TaxID=2100421 RepID=A0A6J7XJ48_9CAUD|nr:hypothetical protein UFOVP1444_36 [uncultured Caudovirales phage]CAB5227970.1 hypothetical protein UFOVP1536_24 [uncultured Caudovirales phage]